MAFQNCSVPFNLLKTSSPAKASDISDMINSSEKEILETKAQLTESSSFAAESRAIATDVTTQSTQDKVRLRLKPKAIKKKKNGP